MLCIQFFPIQMLYQVLLQSWLPILLKEAGFVSSFEGSAVWEADSEEKYSHYMRLTPKYVQPENAIAAEMCVNADT